MGRQAVAARYRRTSGAYLHTHQTTLVICQFGRKISAPAVTDLPRQRWLVRHKPRRWSHIQGMLTTWAWISE
jgi:hypothetical protein